MAAAGHRDVTAGPAGPAPRGARRLPGRRLTATRLKIAAVERLCVGGPALHVGSRAQAEKNSSSHQSRDRCDGKLRAADSTSPRGYFRSQREIHRRPGLYRRPISALTGQQIPQIESRSSLSPPPSGRPAPLPGSLAPPPGPGSSSWRSLHASLTRPDRRQPALGQLTVRSASCPRAGSRRSGARSRRRWSRPPGTAPGHRGWAGEPGRATDHRTVAEIVPTVFRDQLYLAYEIPMGRRYDPAVGVFPADYGNRPAEGGAAAQELSVAAVPRLVGRRGFSRPGPAPRHGVPGHLRRVVPLRQIYASWRLVAGRESAERGEPRGLPVPR